jgi:hypothetical protein
MKTTFSTLSIVETVVGHRPPWPRPPRMARRRLGSREATVDGYRVGVTARFCDRTAGDRVYFFVLIGATRRTRVPTLCGDTKATRGRPTRVAQLVHERGDSARRRGGLALNRL